MSTATFAGTIPGVAYTVPLFESVAGADPRVDAEKGIIYGVKVLGFVSRATGRTIGLDPNIYGEAIDQHYAYTREAMIEAAPMYEGIRVYIDHPEFKYRPDGERLVSMRDRKLEEVFGRLVNVRVLETGMFADLEFIRTHPLAAQVVEAASRFPDLLALSHNANGRPVLKNGQLLVEHIQDVRSVDLVGERPGTTHSLFESEAKTMAGATTVGAPDKAEGNETQALSDLVNPVHSGESQLPEDDPVSGGADMAAATMPEDAPAAEPADHFDAAFLKEITDICKGNGTGADKAAKIKALLDAQDNVNDIRGGGDGDEPAPDVGADLDETDPEPGDYKADDKKPDDKKLPETAPAVAAAPAKPATAQAPAQISKAKLCRQLLETTIMPCVDLLTAAAVPVKRSTLSALVFMPAKERQSFVATLAESAPRQTVPRSQGGAVGLHETSPKAPARAAAKPAAAAAPQKAKVSEAKPESVVEFLRGVSTL